MGASGWEYVVPYQREMAAALADLRRRVFADGSYVSPAELGLPVPATLDELVSEPHWEFMGTCGTHSIIDVLSAAPADDEAQEYATIRALTDREYLELWGSPQPTRDDSRGSAIPSSSTNTSTAAGIRGGRPCCGRTAARAK